MKYTLILEDTPQNLPELLKAKYSSCVVFNHCVEFTNGIHL